MTEEKMKKWLERKPAGFKVPVPIPHLRECLKCFKVYSHHEYRFHKIQEAGVKNLKINLTNNKG